MTLSNVKRRGAIMACALLGGVVGCNRQQRAEPAPAACVAQQANNDGEALFRALFLGDGTAIAALPMLEPRNTASADVNLVATQNATVALLSTRDPQFFNRFATALHSGNHIAVEKALDDAAAAFAVAARDARYPTTAAPGSGLWWYHASYWFIHTPEPEAVGSNASRLYKQQLVDAIASALAPCSSTVTGRGA